MHLSKPINCTTPAVNPHVNYRLWVTMTCQSRFNSGSKGTALVRAVDDVGGRVCRGGKSVWETSAPSALFF